MGIPFIPLAKDTILKGFLRASLILSCKAVVPIRIFYKPFFLHIFIPSIRRTALALSNLI